MRVIERDKIWRWLLKIAVVPIFVCVTEAEEIICRVASSPPVIDGKLDDKCWKDSVKVTGFILDFADDIEMGQFQGNHKDLHGRVAPDDKQTVVYITYDSKNLYLGFECKELHPERLKANAQGRDDRVWLDDCVEIFLDIECSQKTYYQIIINSKGEIFDHFVKEVKKGKKKGTISLDANVRWDGDIEVETSINKEEWIAEVRISLESLNLKIEQGKSIGVNFTREQYTLEEEPKGLFTTFANISGHFQQPDKFGRLTFK